MKKLLTGQRPLHTVFWLYGVTAVVFYIFLLKFIEQNYVSILMITGGEVFIYVTTLLPFIYFPLIFIAIWQSADKYTGPRIWVYLAKAAVFLTSLLLVLIAYVLIKSLLADKISPELLQEEVNVINRSLPVKIDSETELTRVSATDTGLYYHYKLTNKSRDDMNESSFKNLMKEQLIKAACPDNEVQKILASNLDVNFEYVDKNNNVITTVTLQQSDCVTQQKP